MNEFWFPAANWRWLSSEMMEAIGHGLFGVQS